jgi:hypothetical protein
MTLSGETEAHDAGRLFLISNGARRRPRSGGYGATRKPRRQ